MKIEVRFDVPVSKERMLHNLRNVKKIVPILKSHLFEIIDEKYLVKDDEGKVISEFKYLIDEETHAIHFDKFKGKLKEEIEKMLTFDFPEEVGEKCLVFDYEKKRKMYFSLSEWFLMEKNKTYKVCLDRQKLVEVELYHIPLEARCS